MTKPLTNPRPPGERGQGRKPQATVRATPYRQLVSLPYGQHFVVTMRTALGAVMWCADEVLVMPHDDSLLRLILPDGKTIELCSGKP